MKINSLIFVFCMLYVVECHLLNRFEFIRKSISTPETHQGIAFTSADLEKLNIDRDNQMGAEVRDYRRSKTSMEWSFYVYVFLLLCALCLTAVATGSKARVKAIAALSLVVMFELLIEGINSIVFPLLFLIVFLLYGICKNRLNEQNEKPDGRS